MSLARLSAVRSVRRDRLIEVIELPNRSDKCAYHVHELPFWPGHARITGIESRYRSTSSLFLEDERTTPCERSFCSCTHRSTDS